jgi:hypothetical protein
VDGHKVRPYSRPNCLALGVFSPFLFPPLGVFPSVQRFGFVDEKFLSLLYFFISDQAVFLGFLPTICRYGNVQTSLLLHIWLDKMVLVVLGVRNYSYDALLPHLLLECFSNNA